MRSFGFASSPQDRLNTVAAAPVLGPAIQDIFGAIGSGVLRGGEAVERVIGEALTSRGVAVIGDAPDVPIIRVPGMEIIADREYRLSRCRGPTC